MKRRELIEALSVYADSIYEDLDEDPSEGEGSPEELTGIDDAIQRDVVLGTVSALADRSPGELLAEYPGVWPPLYGLLLRAAYVSGLRRHLVAPAEGSRPSLDLGRLRHDDGYDDVSRHSLKESARYHLWRNFYHLRGRILSSGQGRPYAAFEGYRESLKLNEGTLP